MRYIKINWKYRLTEMLVLQSRIRPAETVGTEWVTLDPDGRLALAKGYAWDGPSGPALHTPNFMAPSAGHDALYQLIRRGHLPQACFEPANKDMRRWCRERGMWEFRVWYCFEIVQLFGDRHLDRRTEVYEAP